MSLQDKLRFWSVNVCKILVWQILKIWGYKNNFLICYEILEDQHHNKDTLTCIYVQTATGAHILVCRPSVTHFGNPHLTWHVHFLWFKSNKLSCSSVCRVSRKVSSFN